MKLVEYLEHDDLALFCFLALVIREGQLASPDVAYQLADSFTRNQTARHEPPQPLTAKEGTHGRIPLE